MTLDDAQKQEVGRWIEAGLKLSEIQSKLASQFNLTMTYMEVRLLVDDLKLTPKDQQPPSSTKQMLTKDTAGAGSPSPAPGDPEEQLVGGLPGTDQAAPPGAGSVAVTVDRVARPGTVVSGSVTFTDGNSAAWYLDQAGRLGLAPKQQGYRPSPQDLEVFQLELQSELQKMGY